MKSAIDKLGPPQYHNKLVPALLAAFVCLGAAFVGDQSDITDHIGKEVSSLENDTSQHDGMSMPQPSATTTAEQASGLMSTNGYVPSPADFVSTESGRLAPRSQGVFRISCKASAVGMFDPIVAPGKANASHLHDFHGNLSVSPDSTLDSLSQAATTCNNPADHSVYWHPMLMIPGKDGQEDVAMPSTVDLVYYDYGRADNTPLAIQPPRGLEIIVGEATNTAPLDMDNLYFQCVGRDDDNEIVKSAPTPELTVCQKDQVLSAVANAPNCWDGVNLDSADHKSHMAYPINGDCPPDHPIKTSEEHIRVRWSFPGAKGAYLSSDLMTPAGKDAHGTTWHVDILENWDEGILASTFAECLQDGSGCKIETKLPTTGLPGPYPAGIYPASSPAATTMARAEH